MPTTITALLADQTHALRFGVKWMLSNIKVKVVAETDNGRDAVKLAAKHHPNVVVIDIDLPMLNGIEATRQIVGANAGTRVIFFTWKHDDIHIERAMQLNVHGYVLKSSPVEIVAEAVTAVSDGQQWIEKEIREHMARYAHLPGYGRTPSLLSDREVEILQLIGEGHQVKEIARIISISDKTVEVHLTKLMKKLNIHDRATLVRYAIRTGLVSA